MNTTFKGSGFVNKDIAAKSISPQKKNWDKNRKIKK